MTNSAATIQWDDERQLQANAEGWGIWNNGQSVDHPLYEIERTEADDTLPSLFASDEAARLFVEAAADHGHRLAIHARAYLEQERLFNQLNVGMEIHKELSEYALLHIREGYLLLANLAEELAMVAERKRHADSSAVASHLDTAKQIYNLLPRWAKTFGAGSIEKGERQWQ